MPASGEAIHVTLTVQMAKSPMLIKRLWCNNSLDYLSATASFAASCNEIFRSFALQISRDSTTCTTAKLKSFLCGCGQPFFAFDGLDTVAKQRASIWLTRVAAVLSVFGSSWIIYDSLSKKKKRSATYHQILIGMSIFDIFGSLAHCRNNYIFCIQYGCPQDNPIDDRGRIVLF
jgi:hypothetical protein